MRFFDTSADGFWRSFQAIVLVVPVYALTALADRHGDALGLRCRRQASATAPSGSAQAVALRLDWVTLPILLGVLAGLHRHPPRLSRLRRRAQLGDAC